MSEQTNRYYEFGSFSVDVGRRVLLCSGKPVPLTPKVLETLLVMIENRGRVLTKDELLNLVWGDTIVEEGGLTRNVSVLRKVLGERPDDHQYIVTVPGRGYQFVAQVHERGNNGKKSRTDVPAAPEQEVRPRATHLIRRSWVLSGLLTLALGLTMYVLYIAYRRAAATHPEIKSIAVLPLQNLSGDPTQEYFAEGMTEALISSLAQIRALRVISRTSVMSFKGTQKPLPPLPEIARELKVDGVVEGTVQRENGRVKISIQLIHGPTDTHLWARDYERALTDVLQLQGEMARAVAEEIRIQVNPEERARLASARSIDPEAQEAYLLGRYHFWKLNEEGLKRAIGHFERAIQIDPKYAVAHADLSLAWQYRSFFGAATLQESESPARGAAQRALDLDDRQAAAHFAVGHVKYLYDWSWAGAEKDYRRALELDPNNLDAHYYYSKLLQTVGRLPEAIYEIERARQLDPLSSMVESFFGQALYNARKYDEAVPHLKRAIELEPRNFLACGRLADVYAQMGRYDDALAYEEKAGGGGYFIARVYAKMGKRTKARRMLEELSAKRSLMDLLPRGAGAYAALGDNDEAFRLLMKQIEEHALPGLFFIKVNPYFDSLHSDPRWNVVLRRMNLPVE